MSIYTKLHQKYGAATHVAEFRLFILNTCLKTCESCFYKRSGNSINTYQQAFQLAVELEEKKYRLETCYLLPTDFFDNSSNLLLIERENVKKILKKFVYIGIASTFEGDINFSPIVKYLKQVFCKLEVQINLVKERLFDDNYFQEINENKKNLQAMLDGKVVFNLALNLGLELSEKELNHIHYLVSKLSDDGVIEVNFTFLYNQKIRKKLKTEKLIQSLKSMQLLGKMYNKEESRYNNRTFLKKPAFFFKDDKVYLSPIVPFDEYVFVDSPKFSLNEITFNGFLETVASIEENNLPILEDCYTCPNLSVCLGKAYFVAAREFDLSCFLQASKHPSLANTEGKRL